MAYLKHYGTPRHSGRYPWGSGENPYQHGDYLLAAINDLRKEGLSDTDIAATLGMSTTEFRKRRSLAKNQAKNDQVAEIMKLKAKGYSNEAIGEKLGISEGTVRYSLKESTKERTNKTNETAKQLKEAVDSKGYIDIGKGNAQWMGIKDTQLGTAVQKLVDEGYITHNVQIDQLGTADGNKTTIKVLCPPGTTYADVVTNIDKIKTIQGYVEKDGRTSLNLEKPVSISSDRVMIRYAEDGGKEKDGVIELRRGVDDISLKDARYAQVRIGVDDTHYLKGMAMYTDEKMPPGVDIIFNTNKHKDKSKMEVLKPMKHIDENDPNSPVDWDNPFGATIKTEDKLKMAQRYYKDKNGDWKLSSLNIVNEEGDWGEWKKTIASQMLSKQYPSTAKKQLNEMYQSKLDEYRDISKLTNPVIKEKLLTSFAESCDSATVHLEAAAFPRQASHVILPFPDIKPNEVYAPKYQQGEEVVLIRYPHGGIFEIPRLKVNNHVKSAQSVIPNAKDAIGINAKVAEQLSGADFDGDTVLVIPTRGQKIKTSSPIQSLIDFDPKESYPAYPGMPRMTPTQKGQEMGQISNLITDMTIKGASLSEITRAVKHSMVVIDAEKHYLNYKKSEDDFQIRQLKAKYQGGARNGASTIISRSSSEARIPVRKEAYKPDPETGKKIFYETGETYKKVTKSGKIKEYPRLQKTYKMLTVDDANDLSSGSNIEVIFATHANKLKALANKARKDSMHLSYIPYSPTARKAYAKEVDSLLSQLNIAKKNKPLERQAQILGNVTYREKKANHPEWDGDDKRKYKAQALEAARYRVGAKKQLIKISPKEWEAIQAGAVTKTQLRDIIDNTDLDILKQYAMPRSEKVISDSVRSRAKQMSDRGLTLSEISDRLGISASSVSDIVNG
jgi:DNA-binding CsgD family transcriptional regulator